MNEETKTTESTPVAAEAKPEAQPIAQAAAPTQLGMSFDQVREHADVVRRATEAEAKLKSAADKQALEAESRRREEQAAQAAKQAAQVTSLEATNASIMAQLRRSRALEQLQGIKDPETFLPLVDSIVQLDESLSLTEESIEKLKAFRSEKPYLFAEQTPAAHATTPAAAAGHTPAEGHYSKEDQETFRLLGVTPGAYKQSEKYNAIGWIFGHDSRGKVN